MANEIEHKYLVREDGWRPRSAGTAIRQGYLCSEPERVVRVRVEAEKASLTIKGHQTGLTRAEFEYEIPRADAEAMLATLCAKPLIEKTRYEEVVDGRAWEIDVFHGANEGLVVAELEVSDESESFSLPSWIDREVSDDPRYLNVNLARNPWRGWRER